MKFKRQGVEVEVARDGTKKWWFNGRLHREDGPAVEWSNGECNWLQHGRLHRIDGPAIEYEDGTKDWFINGHFYPTEEKWFQALTPDQQYDFLWKLGV